MISMIMFLVSMVALVSLFFVLPGIIVYSIILAGTWRALIALLAIIFVSLGLAGIVEIHYEEEELED